MDVPKQSNMQCFDFYGLKHSMVMVFWWSEVYMKGLACSEMAEHVLLMKEDQDVWCMGGYWTILQANSKQQKGDSRWSAKPTAD
jgi:hypothetical protein